MKMLKDTDFCRLMFLYGRRLDIQIQIDLGKHEPYKLSARQKKLLQGELKQCNKEIEELNKLMEE